MTITTIAGPFKTKMEAEDTAAQLGSQCSAYGKHRTDADGFTLDECDWFVEKDDTIASNKIFGYDTQAFLRRQYK